MSDTDSWIDEILVFGYDDPTFIHDIHVLIGGEEKVAKAKAAIEEHINKAVKEAEDKIWNRLIEAVGTHEIEPKSKSIGQLRRELTDGEKKS